MKKPILVGLFVCWLCVCVWVGVRICMSVCLERISEIAQRIWLNILQRAIILSRTMSLTFWWHSPLARANAVFLGRQCRQAEEPKQLADEASRFHLGRQRQHSAVICSGAIQQQSTAPQSGHALLTQVGSMYS